MKTLAGFLIFLNIGCIAHPLPHPSPPQIQKTSSAFSTQSNQIRGTAAKPRELPKAARFVNVSLLEPVEISLRPYLKIMATELELRRDGRCLSKKRARCFLERVQEGLLVEVGDQYSFDGLKAFILLQNETGRLTAKAVVIPFTDYGLRNLPAIKVIEGDVFINNISWSAQEMLGGMFVLSFEYAGSGDDLWVGLVSGTFKGRIY